MTTLFPLNADWRLAYDPNQWILQRRPTPKRASSSAISPWQSVSFIGSHKSTLTRLYREEGIKLTPEAEARMDALPERFLDFIKNPVLDPLEVPGFLRRVA